MSQAAAVQGEVVNQRVERRSRSADDRPLPDDTTVENSQSPEDALAAAHRAIEERDAKIKAEQDRAAKAEAASREANRALANTTLARVSDQEVAYTGQIEAATAAKSSAVAAIRAARELGDIDAELKAQDSLAAASYRLNQLTDAKAQFDARKGTVTEQAKAAVTNVQQAGPTPEAQAWIETHPRFNTDKSYRAAAIGAHDLALQEGYVEGSSAYLNFINSTLDDIYGQNHDTTGKPMNGNQTRASSVAATPSRGGYDAGDSLSNDGINLRLSRNSDGKEILSGTIPAEWVEGAEICGMDPTAYAIEQMKIRNDQKAGKGVGLYTGEGVVYR